jgi:N-glycosylase/DNA lyase
MARRVTALPEPWSSMYVERAEAIRARLDDFGTVKPEDYFYELAYCILTPQSSARNADAVISELRRDKFQQLGFDPTAYLRDPVHYIRFHNTKAKRLLAARESLPAIFPQLITDSLSALEKRTLVLAHLNGLGMKESSHFLRNIGVRGLAILDRHIFKHLARLEVIAEIPKNAPTPKRYLEIEQAWLLFAERVGIPLDELDLLFWSMETGQILK